MKTSMASEPNNSRRIKSAAALFILLTLLLSGIAMAQNGGSFSVPWWTVDSGGGSSGGTRFAVSGTIGQPDASPPMSGARFGLQGGFWPAAGLTLALLVLVPPRRWGWILAGVAVAELGGDLVHGYPLGASLWWMAGNSIEPLIGATLLRRWGNPSGSLVDFRSRRSAASEAVGYGKTAMLFHMLRRSVGDDAFLAVLGFAYR